MAARLRTVLWACALTLALASHALASGRAGARVEFGPFSIRAYVEQVLMYVGPLEVDAGLDLRGPPWTVTPYTAVVYNTDTFWLAVEVARPLSSTAGFRFALSGGVAW